MIVRRRLRNRMLLVVSGLALGICLLFSLYTVAFTYAVEDAFFDAHLQEEAAGVLAQRDASGRWPRPRDAGVAVHTTTRTLPPQVRDLLRAEPARSEFPGADGHHYHLRELRAADGERAWLLYDVGQRLVVRPMRDRLLLLLACTTAALLALSLLVGYWASRRTTRKLEQLAAAVAGFDPSHPPESWPQSDDADEVGTVAAGLEAMTRRLRAFIERERSFTRDASHELRTPLAVIRSAGDQLLGQPELTPRSRQHADLIRDSTARLEQIVDMLLALARETGLEGAQAPAPLLPLIEQTILDQSLRLEGKPIEVEVEVPASARLDAPRVAVQVILANLIGNAFAHSLAGTVRIDTGEGCLRIGNPVADERLPPNADEFAMRGVSADGFGFGLGITRRVCDRFGLALDLRVEHGRVVARLPLAA